MGRGPGLDGRSPEVSEDRDVVADMVTHKIYVLLTGASTSNSEREARRTVA
jgi:hypothetical protein